MSSRWVFHPILIALFPILFFYAHNRHETSASDLLVPLAVVLPAVALLWGAFAWMLRDTQKGAVLASMLVALFFMYGHLLRAVESLPWEFNWRHLPQKILLLEAAVFTLAACVVARRNWQPRRLTRFLNTASLIAVSMPLLTTLTELVPRSNVAPHLPQSSLAVSPRHHPDIYLIVLDGHGRHDVLRELYDYDCKPFLDFLQSKGFYVARQSIANYCYTRLALASSLNLRYLQAAEADPEASYDLIRQPLLVDEMKRLGYRTVAVSSGMGYTEMPPADDYLRPPRAISRFEQELVRTTLLSLTSLSDRAVTQSVRQRMECQFDNLPKVARDRRATFTFAHVMLPHPPFVFGAAGEDIAAQYIGVGDLSTLPPDLRQRYVDGYRQQITYLHKRIGQVIERILADSPEPPVIILHSDHGPRARMDWESAEKTDVWELMSNLTAVHFPGGADGLYPQISPVNLYRLMLNRCFGAELELLEDRAYFSGSEDPGAYIDVTARVRAVPNNRADFSKPSADNIVQGR